MKKRQHALPCGRVIVYEEITPKDIGNRISKYLIKNKSTLKGIVYSKNTPNKRWVPRVYNKFTTTLVKHLLDCLMQGDRIATFEDRQWMIAGAVLKNDKHLNWHTDGLSYSIRIKNLPGSYGIRMARKSRMELMRRINAGQKYHVV